ncbi:MAG: ATP synthase subunit delta [Bacteroidetes bacterium ADurb.Bin217]|nr:MAG: ATP synthase subunit delta [Bacteroidetes bacterium ADurb.Bin217]
MNQSKISVRYAKALYEFGEEKKVLATLVDDVKMLASSFAEIKELRDFVLNPIIKPSDKKNFIHALLSKKVSADTIQFLNMIITNKRELYIEDMLRNFLNMCRRNSGITSVTLTTAQTFSASQKKTITSFVEKTYKTNVELIEKTDTTLLGGFILRIDDLQYDASVKTKIHALKKELLQSN